VRRLLTGHQVVFLDVSITGAAPRIGFNRDRPLLLGNPRAQWVRLMDARRPFYEEVASITVHTDGRTPDEVVADIVRLLPEVPPSLVR
jgi:shikimate kinase